MEASSVVIAYTHSEHMMDILSMRIRLVKPWAPHSRRNANRHQVRRDDPFPSFLLGEEPAPGLDPGSSPGVAGGRMGYGQLPQRWSDCTSVAASLPNEEGCFPHPIRPHRASRERLSTPYGATFPASRRRSRAHRLARARRPQRQLRSSGGALLAHGGAEAESLGRAPAGVRRRSRRSPRRAAAAR